MECFLPSSALQRSGTAGDDACDSTKCVDPSEQAPASAALQDVTTPVCNPDSSEPAKTEPGCSLSTTKASNDSTEVASVGVNTKRSPCRSPSLSSLDSRRRKRKRVGSFALDSMSNVVFSPDGDITVLDPFPDKLDDPKETLDNPLDKLDNLDSSSPVTFTPVKSARACHKRVDVFDSLHTRLDEPHLNISDDANINPILANSIVRTRGESDREDIRRSLEVLGNSRCWTDRFKDSDGTVSATETPIRSISSRFSSSQADSQSSFMCQSPFYAPEETPIRSINRSTTGSVTRSITRSVNRYARPRVHPDSKEDTLEKFRGTEVVEMLRMPFNPMCRVVLPKEQMRASRLSDELDMLYRHFKNMCVITKRSSMRSDLPLFRVVQMLVQRMSRRSFSLDQLRQMLWLAPNLLSVRWVVVTESFRKRYSNEYKDSSDKVFDLCIKFLRPDLCPCFTTRDYENVCLRFKTVLVCWSTKCGSRFANFAVPLAEIPDKGVGSLHSTPRRDLTPIRIDTPVRSILRPDSMSKLDSTPVKSVRMADSAGKVPLMSPMSVDLLDTPGMRRIRERAKQLAEERRQTQDREKDLRFWIDLRWFTNILLDVAARSQSVLTLDSLVDQIIRYTTRRVTIDQVTRWVDALSEIDPLILDKAVSKFADYSTVLTINKSASINDALDYINRKIKTLKSF